MYLLRKILTNIIHLKLIEIEYMQKALSLLNKDQISKGYQLIFLMFIASIIEIFGLGMVLLIINSFLNINSDNIFQNYLINYFEVDSKGSYFKIIFIFLTVSFTLKFFILVFTSWKESLFLADIRKKISSDLYKNFIYRIPEKVFKKNSAEYLRNFVEEINGTVVFYSNILKIILDLLLFLGFAIFLIVFEPKMFLVVFFVFGLIAGIYFYSLKNKLLQWAKEALKNKKKRIQFINESFNAIKYIKILSAEKFFLKKFKFQNDSLSNIIHNQGFVGSIPRYLLEYILFLTIVVILFILLKLNYENKNIIQILSIYTIAAFRIVPIINKLLTSSQQLRFTYPSLEKLYNEQREKIVVQPEKIIRFSFNKKIELKFKNFSFKKNKKNNILKNVNISFPKYSKIGIIGPSGSGKSTLINMICGFIASVNRKMITVDGKSIFENLNGWQSQIGYIPQNIVILDRSLRENILFGVDSNIYTDKQVLEVIKKVELTKFLKSLKQKLSHRINQDGLNISGGEKQRIGMARALLRNPEILILDEATSGLDMDTEKKIIKTIKRLNKTIIFVSHRITALSFCDKIYNIENNTIKTINTKKLLEIKSK